MHRCQGCVLNGCAPAHQDKMHHGLHAQSHHHCCMQARSRRRLSSKSNGKMTMAGTVVTQKAVEGIAGAREGAKHPENERHSILERQSGNRPCAAETVSLQLTQLSRSHFADEIAASRQGSKSCGCADLATVRQARAVISAQSTARNAQLPATNVSARHFEGCCAAACLLIAACNVLCKNALRDKDGGIYCLLIQHAVTSHTF